MKLKLIALLVSMCFTISTFCKVETGDQYRDKHPSSSATTGHKVKKGVQIAAGCSSTAAAAAAEYIFKLKNPRLRHIAILGAMGVLFTTLDTYSFLYDFIGIATVSLSVIGWAAYIFGFLPDPPPVKTS